MALSIMLVLSGSNPSGLSTRSSLCASWLSSLALACVAHLAPHGHYSPWFRERDINAAVALRSNHVSIQHQTPSPLRNQRAELHYRSTSDSLTYQTTLISALYLCGADWTCPGVCHSKTSAAWPALSKDASFCHGKHTKALFMYFTHK